jgi:NAD(P)-dependent dehydrogenase (short-subunit alcohol dehydrogenase family)
MSTQNQKVAIVTGASQGIGAGVVEAYRKLGYAVVATSRTIAPADDADILTVQGDIADPATAERSSPPRSSGSAASTRWSTTRASSSPSRSPTTPRTTTRP